MGAPHDSDGTSSDPTELRESEGSFRALWGSSQDGGEVEEAHPCHWRPDGAQAAALQRHLRICVARMDSLAV
jgi:hypothetical protein